MGSHADAVCRSSLDDLAKEFMAVEGMPEAGDMKAPAETVKWRQCENVRRITEEESVLTGLAATDSMNESVLKDQRLLFLLKKQEVVEVMRLGNSTDALERARKQLSALALDAYPEAYEEFKCAMTAFLWPAGTAGTPRDVACLWEPSQRIRAAETLANTLKLAVGARDSQLSYVIRYLLLTNRAYHMMDTRSRVAHRCDAGCQLAASLLLPHREERPMVPECSGGFPEATVQALAQAAELSRQEAIGALRRSDGDEVDAIKAELGCFRLDMRLLSELVREYAYARDLVAGPPNTHPDESAPMAADDEGAKSPKQKKSPARKPCQPGNSPRQAGSGESGGPMSVDGGAGHGSGGSSNGDDGDVATSGGAAAAAAAASGDAAKYAAALRIKQHAQGGNFDEVETELMQLGPRFTDDHPEVLFEVRLCHFSALVAEGKAGDAVSLARTRLTPLAEGNPEREAQVRQALAGLMTKAPRGTNSAAGLQESICRALGLQAPRLLRVLGGLLAVHKVYFAKVRSTDRFERALGVEGLRAASPSSSTAAAAAAASGGGGGGGGGASAFTSAAPLPPPPSAAAAGQRVSVEAWGLMVGDPSSEEEEYSGDEDGEGAEDMEGAGDGEPEVTEANILLTMEFTGLPRPQCVELLLANGNDPNAVMHTLYT